MPQAGKITKNFDLFENRKNGKLKNGKVDFLGKWQYGKLKYGKIGKMEHRNIKNGQSWKHGTKMKIEDSKIINKFSECMNFKGIPLTRIKWGSTKYLLDFSAFIYSCFCGRSAAHSKKNL